MKRPFWISSFTQFFSIPIFCFISLYPSYFPVHFSIFLLSGSYLLPLYSAFSPFTLVARGFISLKFVTTLRAVVQTVQVNHLTSVSYSYIPVCGETGIICFFLIIFGSLLYVIPALFEKCFKCDMMVSKILLWVLEETLMRLIVQHAKCIWVAMLLPSSINPYVYYFEEIRYQ